MKHTDKLVESWWRDCVAYTN